jgi:hypothetical protein
MSAKIRKVMTRLPREWRVAVFVATSAALVVFVLCCLQIFKNLKPDIQISDRINAEGEALWLYGERVSWFGGPGRSLLSTKSDFDSGRLRGPAMGISKQDLVLNNSFAKNPSNLGTGYFSVTYYPSGDCSGGSSFVEAYATDVCLPVPADQSNGQWLSMKYTCVSNGEYIQQGMRIFPLIIRIVSFRLNSLNAHGNIYSGAGLLVTYYKLGNCRKSPFSTALYPMGSCANKPGYGDKHVYGASFSVTCSHTPTNVIPISIGSKAIVQSIYSTASSTTGQTAVAGSSSCSPHLPIALHAYIESPLQGCGDDAYKSTLSPDAQFGNLVCDGELTCIILLHESSRAEICLSNLVLLLQLSNIR